MSAGHLISHKEVLTFLHHFILGYATISTFMFPTGTQHWINAIEASVVYKYVECCVLTAGVMPTWR